MQRKARTIFTISSVSLAAMLSVGTVLAQFAVNDQARAIAIPVRVAKRTYTVSFNTNGGTAVESQQVLDEGKATRPASPTKAGSIFVDWYKDAEFTAVFDFENTPILEDTTIYAKYDTNYDYGANTNGWYLVGNFGNDSAQHFKFSTRMNSNTSLGNDNVAVFDYTFAEGAKFKVVHYTTANTSTGAKWKGYSALKDDFNTGYCYDFFTNDGDDNIVLKSGCAGRYRIYLNNVANDDEKKLWINRFYTVTYQDGNNVLDTQTVQGGTATSKIADPNKDGYVFKKWCSDPELNNEFNFSTLITADTTLYAKWNELFTVKFKIGDNFIDSIQIDDVENGSLITKPADPTAAGKVFYPHWYKEEGLINEFNFNTDTIAANTTLFGRWKNVYTVSFNSNGGSAVSSQTINEGDLATEPSTPTKANSVFRGWYSDSELTEAYVFTTPVNSTFTLYAKWETSYTVTFHVDGAVAPDTQEVGEGEKATRPTDPTKTGYRFDDWYTEETFENVYNFSAVVDDNLDLYGKWIETCVVTLVDTISHSTIDTITVDKGTKATEPADPVHEHYIFDGWYANEECTVAFDFDTEVISVNKSVYAKFDYDYNYQASGYRLIGNFGNVAAAHYSFENGRASDELTDGNKAQFVGVELTAGQSVAIKYFDFTNDVEYGFSALKNQTELFKADGSGRIQILKDGKYSFYLNSSSQIYVRTDLGYYILGQFGNDESNYWKVSTGFKDTKTSGTNIAEFLGVTLTAGKQYKIFNLSAGTSTTATNPESDPRFDIVESNFKPLITGTYNIYLSNTGMYYDAVINPTGTNRIYLDLGTSGWANDGAKFYAYAFHKEGDVTGLTEWIPCTYQIGSYYYADIDYSKYNYVVFVRYDPDVDFNSQGDKWAGKWNQTAEISLTSVLNDKDVVKITGWEKSQDYRIL